jgi:hypothetical protein
MPSLGFGSVALPELNPSCQQAQKVFNEFGSLLCDPWKNYWKLLDLCDELDAGFGGGPQGQVTLDSIQEWYNRTLPGMVSFNELNLPYLSSELRLVDLDYEPYPYEDPYGPRFPWHLYLPTDLQGAWSTRPWVDFLEEIDRLEYELDELRWIFDAQFYAEDYDEPYDEALANFNQEISELKREHQEIKDKYDWHKSIETEVSAVFA